VAISDEASRSVAAFTSEPPLESSISAAPSAAAVARASALNLLARLTSGASAFGLTVLTTHLLDTEGRGIYAIISTWTGIAVMVMGSGTPVLAADLIHGRRDERLLHGAASAIALLSGLLLLPLYAAISLVIGGVPLPLLLSMTALAALLTYSWFEMALAQARGNLRKVSLTDIGISAAPLIPTAVAAELFEPTVTTLITAWAIGALITALVLFVIALPVGSTLIRRAWRLGVGIMRRSVRVALSDSIVLLCARIDLLVVAAVLGTSTAGVYSIPIALATALLLLSRALLTATYHPIMTAPASEVAGRLSAALRHSVIVVLVGGGLSVPVVALTAGFVFGDAYRNVWEPYAILVPASACTCVTEMLRHFLITRMERQREFMLVAAGMLVVNGALAVAGAAAFGMLGAATSTTVTYACGAVATVAISARLLSVPMRDLAVPRRSDLAVYPRLLRTRLGWRRNG
jgi:O-antigen/teichoic acid export membrane protein